MSPRWRFLSAWVQAVYLNSGPGTGWIDLSVEDRTKCRDRFPLWLAMHQTLGTDELLAAEWLLKGEQFARWLGVSVDALCDLLMQVQATHASPPPGNGKAGPGE